MSNYPSPNESRAPQGKRASGREFYRQQGRRPPGAEKSGTEKRDGRRAGDERAAAELGRELAALAEKFPRFRPAINKLQHHVLVQARSLGWKKQTVLRCLNNEPLSVDEVSEETGLDQHAALATLYLLERESAAEKVNRTGHPVLIRRDNKPAEKVYWRRKQNTEVRSQKASSGS